MADTAKDAQTLKDDREAFELARDTEDHNRVAYEEDVRFARLEEQWPSEVIKQRDDDKVPSLTANELGAYIKQVVNEARQNKPSIKVQPVDDKADPHTAEVLSGVIRNIETVSSADIAYDWGVDCAASGGFGYLRVVDEYAHDDSFDMDLFIRRVLDPLTIYGDPHSTEPDGSDWMSAFVVTRMRKTDFENKYNKAQPINWDAEGYTAALGEWFSEEEVLVAERWIREEIDKPICLLSDGSVVSKKDLEEETDGVPYGEFLAMQGVTINRERTAKSWQVKHRLMTGAEILEEKEWKGKYIPIVPVYGEEIFLDGKRYFRSLIRSAKDSQRQKNFWESLATEMAGLQPKVPFIGPEKAFDVDREKWTSANIRRWPFLRYKGDVAPQRQPIDMGPAAAALAEASRASENIKRTLGMYGDAVRQTVSPESGKALTARKREEDVGTFHFSDNMARSIRHVGRILIDLIPHYYSQARILRVLGEDGTPEMVPLGQPVPVTDKQGQPQMQPNPMPGGPPIPMTRIIDLTKGKYDLVVKSGPSYSTRREESATQMTEMVRAMPDVAPIIMDLIAKNLDWPGAEEIAERFKAMVPGQAKGGLPPEIQKQMQEAQEVMKKLQEENQQLKADKTEEQAKLKIDAFRAETERMKTMGELRLDMTKLGVDAKLNIAGMGMQHQRETQRAEQMSQQRRM